MNSKRATQGSPFLPKLTVLMSIPLYMQSLIKHDMVPSGILFVLVYTWALVSLVVVPVLSLVECWFVTRTWLVRHDPRALRWHATGLGIGIGSLLSLLAVR